MCIPVTRKHVSWAGLANYEQLSISCNWVTRSFGPSLTARAVISSRTARVSCGRLKCAPCPAPARSNTCLRCDGRKKPAVTMSCLLATLTSSRSPLAMIVKRRGRLFGQRWVSVRSRRRYPFRPRCRPAHRRIAPSDALCGSDPPWRVWAHQTCEDLGSVLVRGTKIFLMIFVMGRYRPVTLIPEPSPALPTCDHLGMTARPLKGQLAVDLISQRQTETIKRPVCRRQDQSLKPTG